jgi:hypothetical protein
MHPDGQYVANAQIRIAELNEMEAQAFVFAQANDTEEAYASLPRHLSLGVRMRRAADGRRAVLAAPRLAAEEKAEWAEAQSQDRIEHYEIFLDNWPRGEHAAAAQTRLAALWKTDQGYYLKASRSGSVTELAAFIRAYPEFPLRCRCPSRH